jgi:hypothetical protein
LYLINNSGGAVTLANNAAATANKIFTGTGANYNLPNQATAHLIYNATLGAWQLAGTSPAAAANAWDLLGNAGTNANINFLGTTDANALAFRTNNNIRMRLTLLGRVEIPNSLNSTIVGDLAGNETMTGSNNTLIGFEAGRSITTGNQNVIVGDNAGYFITGGSNNTFLGYQAGNNNQTGTGNTIIGYNANVSAGNLNNAAAIGNGALVSTNNAMVLGNSAVNVGINTSAPTDKLHLVGTNQTTLRIEDGNQGQGRILKSTADGSAYWSNTRTEPVHVSEVGGVNDYLVNCSWVKIWSPGNSTYSINVQNTSGQTLRFVYSTNNSTPVVVNIPNATTHTFTPATWFRNADLIELTVSQYSTFYFD